MNWSKERAGLKTNRYKRAAALSLFLLLIFAACLIAIYNLTQKGQEETAVWTAVPLVSEKNRISGSKGGEGGQWPHAIEVSKSDPSLILYGTNTGGIYRSEDGGENWQLSSRGLTSRGCNAFAIDPLNDQYILCAGINDDFGDKGSGIYLSSDRGNTWDEVLKLPIAGNKVYTDGLEYDESSFEEKENRCMRAYYSVVYENGNRLLLDESQKGLYRTEDGGVSWELINGQISDAKLKVDPENGWVYAVRNDGLYVSKDHGENFECTYSGEIAGFDISWKDKCIYLCSDAHLLRGDIEKMDFHFVLSSTYPTHAYTTGIAVSPVNPDNLLIQTIEEDLENGMQYNIYYSNDKGKNWGVWKYNEEYDFFPYLSFSKIFAWSYKDENQVWSFGGEHVIASKNGGADWTWSSQGICGVLCGGKFHFNIFDPDIIFLGMQDLNGALTIDGGKTWKYIDVSGNGGWGHVYGGYAADEQTFWGCLSQDWSSPGTIVITFDAGKSFVNTGKVLAEEIANADVSSYQSYNDPNIFFAGNYRSTDGGRTWKEMEDCLQVYSHNPMGEHELYGCEKGEKGYVLVSYDEGEKWSRVNKKEIPLIQRSCISDVKIDEKNMLLYVAVNGCELYQIDIETGETVNLTKNLLEDQMGNIRVSSIAVDPKNDRIYIAGAASDYNRTNSLLYSTDGGKTWKNDLLSEKYNGQIIEGAMCLDIHSSSQELWIATACHGLAKLGYVRDRDA